MGRKLIAEAIVFDGEKHTKGALCWCHPEYEDDTDTYVHHLRIDKGCNISRSKDYKA